MFNKYVTITTVVLRAMNVISKRVYTAVAFILKKKVSTSWRGDFSGALLIIKV